VSAQRAKRDLFLSSQFSCAAITDFQSQPCENPSSVQHRTIPSPETDVAEKLFSALFDTFRFPFKNLAKSKNATTKSLFLNILKLSILFTIF
jgi:hypothetical protein